MSQPISLFGLNWHRVRRFDAYPALPIPCRLLAQRLFGKRAGQVNPMTVGGQVAELQRGGAALLPAKEFALKLLHQERVAVVPGTAFGACGEGYLRCCYATNIDLLKEAMSRMARFVKKVRG